jgi:FtsP/CotA-like multicopper oxidase with cupredoxin domain
MVQATHTKFTSALVIPQVLTGADVTLNAVEADIQVLAGQRTRMWTFNGTFPGPTIRRPTGQQTRIIVNNQLNNIAPPRELTVHNHGSHTAPINDGWPCGFFINPGGSRTYTHPLRESDTANPTGNERGTTQWYHDHRVDFTGRNVWMGLAGFFIIDDPADPQTLPSGAFDVPLMIVDRQFNAQNQIPYVFNANGNVGDHILVNGVPQPFFNVGDRRYRFRILNASNFRFYTYRLVDTTTGQTVNMQQVGTESGLLPAPVTVSQVGPVGPAQRVDVVINFAGRLGRNLVLRNENTDGGGPFGGSGGSTNPALQEIMQFRVNQDLTDNSSVPNTLRAIPAVVNNPNATRSFQFDRENNNWTINDVEMNCATSVAQPRINTTERWTLNNPGPWAHAVHIHGVDQRCVSRNGGACPANELFKETWPLLEDTTYVVQLRFADFTSSIAGGTGSYVLHCHVLEHEDEAMMANWEVRP